MAADYVCHVLDAMAECHFGLHKGGVRGRGVQMLSFPALLFLLLSPRACCSPPWQGLPAHMFVFYNFSIPLSWSTFETLQCSAADEFEPSIHRGGRLI